LAGQPRGRGKVERYLGTASQMCLPALPGYAPRGTRDRAALARLTLAELDAAVGEFIVKVCNHRVHGETGKPPQARWETGGFLPRLPESAEQLDLLLLTVAKPRKARPDGICFQGLRYLAPVLAAYAGEPVTIRYDPRDLAEIRVFHRDRFLTRATCPDLAAATVSLKKITAARTARRRELRRQTGERASVADRLIAVHAPPPPGPPVQAAVTAKGQPEPLPKLGRYRQE
jgi:putative transposase